MSNQDHDILIKIHTQVNELHKVMFGNGQPGLSSRVDKIEEFSKNCPARNRRWNDIITIAIAFAVLITMIFLK